VSSNLQRWQRANLVRELIPAARDRSDQIAVGPQCLSQDGNSGLKIVFLDNPPGPHAAHQLVLADDPSPGVDQSHQ
jgi:hypothetical protein